MGSSANFAMPGYAALLIGAAAGLVSTLGYIYLTPLLRIKIKKYLRTFSDSIFYFLIFFIQNNFPS